MQSRSYRVALKVVSFYATGAAAWIIGSDVLVSIRTQAPVSIASVNIAKGLLFVLVTSLILFELLRRVLAEEMQARVKAEQAADQLTELQQIAEHGGELFYKHDRQHRFTYVSPQAYRLTGYQPGEFSDEWMKLTTDNPLNQRALELTERALKTGEKQAPYLVELLRKDGTPVLLEIDESPLRDATGKVVGVIGAARDVTQREKSEQALREREELYRAVFESANDGILLLEGDSFIDCNRRAAEMFGATKDELIGSEPADFSPETQPGGRLSREVQDEINRNAEAGIAKCFQWQHCRKDGSLFDAEVSVRSFTLGSRQLILAIVRDITLRLRTNEALELSNRVYSLLGHVNEAIVRISDEQTLVDEVCRIAVEHGGFRLAWVGMEQPGQGVLSVVAKAGYDEGYLAQARISSSDDAWGRGPAGTAYREARVVICPDIAADPLMAPWREAALPRGYRSLVGLPLKRGGRVVGVLTVYSAQPNSFSPLITETLIKVAADIGFALDIFERNRQRELEQQQLRVQQSALEAAANAIAITDVSGNILWVNKAFTRLTGYAAAEVLGRNPRVLKSGVHKAEFYRQIWRQISAGYVWQGLLTNKRKDGTLYEEEMTVTPVRGEAGNITHYIAIKQDVTERKRLEHQFLRAQRMQSIGLLAGGVAHDLNNVLAPVLMALPLLRAPLSPEDREQILETLEKSVTRGANIVQQVLTYARGVEVERAPVQLRHIIREVTRIAQETFPRDIDVRTSIYQQLWPVMGDPTQIHQVLLNLAVNARDAMPEGGQLLFSAQNVELSSPRQFLDAQVPAGSYVSVSVSDTGTGISAEILERIFEPFFTTKPAGKGTGLGLSTVLGIVKSHGGLVEVESKLGAGSKFTVLLPSAPTTEQLPAEPAPEQLFRGSGEKVLVVDDEPAVLKITSDTLKAHGFEVLTARDGREALARIEQNSADLKAVITDLMMPNCDGLTLTRSVRALCGNLPIIAVTGLLNPPGEPDRAERLRELGVEHVLRKPFTAEELLGGLREVLEAKPQI